jgi:integration host factor subunit beta
MVKSELIEKLAERAGITLFKAEELVEHFFATLSQTLGKNGRIEIRGFGAFSVKEYKSYTGRNPKTGEEVFVPSKRLPVWRTGTELRQRVDSGFGTDDDDDSGDE